MCDTVFATGDPWWPDEEAEHIRSRSERYPGATDLQPEWTTEAARDPYALVRDPDPKSRTGAIRLIGYSHTAGFVITVIIDQVDGAGITAWKARGSDLRDYLNGKENSP